MVAKSKFENGAPSIESIVHAGSKAAETFVKATADAFKSYESVPGFGKENVEAVVRSSTAVAKGFETIGARFAEIAKTSVEESVAASKALMGCTSVQDMIEIQSTIARKQFGKFVSEGAAISELSAKVATDMFAPFASQMNATFGKFTKTAA